MFLGNGVKVVTGLCKTMFAAGLHKFAPGVYMGWGLGANDSANVFGTAVATRVITYRVAVTLTAIFAVIGAVYQGPRVMPLFKNTLLAKRNHF